MKQEKYNRMKIGSTRNIIKRVKKLEKDWGRFDENSEIFYLDTNILKETSLSLDNIEKTIQRILKSKKLYLEQDNMKGKDGYTEFFILEELAIKEVMNIFQSQIEFTKSLLNSSINIVEETYQTKKYFTDLQKFNREVMKEKKENFSISNLQTEKRNKFTTNKSLKELKIENKKYFDELEKYDLKDFGYYSFFYVYDYKNKKVIFNLFANNKIEAGRRDNIIFKIGLILFIKNGGMNIIHGGGVTNINCKVCKRHEILTCKHEVKTRIDFNISYNQNMGNNENTFVRYIIYFLIKLFKRKLKLIPYESNWDKDDIMNKINIKKYRTEIFDNKNTFKLEYTKNKKDYQEYIKIDTIVEYMVASEYLEILFTNGKKIKLYHYVKFILNSFGTYNEESDISGNILTKNDVSDYIKNKLFQTKYNSDFLFHLLRINNIYWYYEYEKNN